MRYLQKNYDWNNPDLVSQYDEFSLWSSYFGHLLLENIPLRSYKKYLDVGCGTGFPLIEMCQKTGPECRGYGIDLWGRALERVKLKIESIGLTNIDLIEGSASTIPFEKGYFDLITSSIGINNFSEPDKVLAECYRVLNKDGVFCITSNVCGTFQEFYEIFQKTLHETGLQKHLPVLDAHINHRGTRDSVTAMFSGAGFEIRKCIESSFSMRFLNGSAFLNHRVINSGFFSAWRAIFTEDEIKPFFSCLEGNLNGYALENGEFRVSVPMLYLECGKLVNL